LFFREHNASGGFLLLIVMSGNKTNTTDLITGSLCGDDDRLYGSRHGVCAGGCRSVHNTCRAGRAGNNDHHDGILPVIIPQNIKIELKI